MESGLQCTSYRFAYAYDTAGIKISTVITDVLHVLRNTNQCLLQLNGETQKQIYKFKYLGVAFTSDRRQNEELDIHIGKNWVSIFHNKSFTLFSSCETRNVEKKQRTQFSNSLCPFSPTLSLYGHKTSVMIKRVRSQVQVSKMRFLQKSKELHH